MTASEIMNLTALQTKVILNAQKAHHARRTVIGYRRFWTTVKQEYWDAARDTRRGGCGTIYKRAISRF